MDESGSFDSSTYPSRFYIISFVFHDQADDLSANIAELEEQLSYLGLPGACIHTGPLIRREENFRSADVHLRRQLFFRLLAFALHAPIVHHEFSIDKRYHSSPQSMFSSLTLQIQEFLSSNASRFAAYDTVKIYYDNGQPQVKSLLKAAFTDPRVTFPADVTPARYRLFQVADLACTVELLVLKKREVIPFTKSEGLFFPSLRDLKKNVVRPLSRNRI